MLEVTFYRDSRQRLSSVFADGHAEFAAAGEDVVCAAVSAILQAARLGLETHCGIATNAQQAAGTLRLELPEGERDRDDVRAVLATAELSIEQIARQYPQHVRVRRAPM
ncbi:MAG TPA: ribosomal-processing cysteine protease Prp [Verrucomicrobiae bacterium]|nr:ribosomal-processing cysteine protease Prp [Verrucomicrobiae bacterium]